MPQTLRSSALRAAPATPADDLFVDIPLPSKHGLDRHSTVLCDAYFYFDTMQSEPICIRRCVANTITQSPASPFDLEEAAAGDGDTDGAAFVHADVTKPVQVEAHFCLAESKRNAVRLLRAVHEAVVESSDAVLTALVSARGTTAVACYDLANRYVPLTARAIERCIREALAQRSATADGLQFLVYLSPLTQLSNFSVPISCVFAQGAVSALHTTLRIAFSKSHAENILRCGQVFFAIPMITKPELTSAVTSLVRDASTPEDLITATFVVLVFAEVSGSHQTSQSCLKILRSAVVGLGIGVFRDRVERPLRLVCATVEPSGALLEHLHSRQQNSPHTESRSDEPCPSGLSWGLLPNSCPVVADAHPFTISIAGNTPSMLSQSQSIVVGHLGRSFHT